MLKATGERQVGTKLQEIEISHIRRYQLATRFINKKDTVLDFGCGAGYGTSMLAKACKHVVGLDISQDAIDHAKEYFGRDNIEYVCSSEPLYQKEFDIVVCLECIEHVENPDEVLLGFYDVLKPGGKLIVSTPNENVMHFNKDNFPFHTKHYLADEFKHDLGLAGFKVISLIGQIKFAGGIFIHNPEQGHFMIGVCIKK